MVGGVLWAINGGVHFEGNVVPLHRSTTGWRHVGHPSPPIQKLGEGESNLPK